MVDAPNATAPWGRCLLCMETAVVLTSEHLFPEAVGGRIKRPILCKRCNSRLGQYIDAAYTKHKLVELARVTYRIAGRNGQIPQPFSDVYTVAVPRGTARIRLDHDFVPRVIGQAPEVSVTESGELSVALRADEQDRKRLPKVLKAALTRFFRSEAGQALGWSGEEQKRAIEVCVDRAMQTEASAHPLDAPIRGKWNLDQEVLYAEFVKVIYEVCCLTFGSAFVECASAARMRAFLLSQCADRPAAWTIGYMQQHLRIVMSPMPSSLESLVQHLCKGNRADYHLAMVVPTGVICTMCNITALYADTDLAPLAIPDEATRVYVNSIKDDDWGVFSLHEALARVASNVVGS